MGKKIWVTGDTHFSIDIGKLTKFRDKVPPGRCRDHIMIIAGDFGLLWEEYPNLEEMWLTGYYDGLPWITLFVDGNHENHDRLESAKEIELFGSKVGKISNSIFHLKRGNIYTIFGKTFFVFGGAASIDKEERIPRLSWWEQEIPSDEEFENAKKNLDAHNWEVDYVITHTAPQWLVNRTYKRTMKDPTSAMLTEIYSRIKCKKWYCGHLHFDKKFKHDGGAGDINVLYQHIAEINVDNQFNS